MERELWKLLNLMAMKLDKPWGCWKLVAERIVTAGNAINVVLVDDWYGQTT